MEAAVSGEEHLVALMDGLMEDHIKGREAGDEDIEPDFQANAIYNNSVVFALLALCVIVWAVMAFLIFAFSDLCEICCLVGRAVMAFLEACRRVMFYNIGCSAAVMALLVLIGETSFGLADLTFFSVAVAAIFAVGRLVWAMAELAMAEFLKDRPPCDILDLH